MGVGGVGDHLLPLRQPGMHGRDGFETLFLAGGLVQPGIAFGGITPEQTGEMRDPREIDLGALERLHQRVRRRAGHFAPRIRAEKRVAIDPHQSVGNAPGGKMRAAFFQRTSAISSFERKVSR